MPNVSDMPTASLAMAVGLCLIALFLGLRQWYEQRARPESISPEDRAYFANQDLRRNLGVGTMVAIALLIAAGPYVPPRVGGRVNLLFVILWMTVLALILVLLILALLDLAATRSYAMRQRREMIRESIDAIRRTPTRPPPAPAKTTANQTGPKAIRIDESSLRFHFSRRPSPDEGRSAHACRIREKVGKTRLTIR